MTKNEFELFKKDEILLISSCKYSIKELAVLLGRSEDSIRAKKFSLLNAEKAREIRQKAKQVYYNKNLSTKHKRKYWSKEHIKLILNSKYTDAQLSKMIGRSMNAITVKRYRLKQEGKK